MNWQNIAFDWNQIRAFLVTAEEGSLSAAARGLGLTQPTLSRQVAALEESLGVTLFERAGRTLVLTETGHRLLTHVRAMGEAAHAVSLTATGQTDSIAGKVSITASDMMSAYALPPIIAGLRDIAPALCIEIVAANDIRNLQHREADIALRNAVPSEPDLIARRLKDSYARVCAARSYLDRAGPIASPEDLGRATWVGYETPDIMVRAAGSLGLALDPGQVRYYSQSGITVWELVRAGLGVTILPVEFLSTYDDIVPLLPDQPPIPFPLYIVTHRELHTNRRIRLVWDTLVAALA